MNSNIDFPIQGDLLLRGLDVVGFWLVGLVILVVVGLWLSRMTLRSATYTQPKSTSRIGLKAFLIRRIYRLVILLACLYFYVSIPILIGILIFAALAVLYLWQSMLDSGVDGGGVRTRVYVLLLPLVFSLMLIYSAFQIVLSIFVSVVLPMRHKLVGRPLPRDEAPEMWKLTDEVAARIGTRPISRIYCRPETMIGVNEQGNILFRILGLSKRCLYLGIGALPDMTQGQFRAILAHEYGHFAHRDTAGGGLAIQVHNAIFELWLSLKSEGMATWTNPAWLFVSGYHFLFWYITLGASRWQEVLADRLAILSYGSRDFIEGLKHVERQSHKFDLQLNLEVRQALKEKRPLQNFYDLPPLEPQWEKEVTIRLQQAQRNATHAFDSHPALPDRIQMAEAINAPVSAEENTTPVWALLPAEQLQSEMNAYLTRKIMGSMQVQYAVEG
jgi:Zn-dependent protease with chaperone function